MKNILLCLLSLFFFIGCVPTSTLYYYGNSSRSYYKAVKNQDEKSIAAYKESLENVFEKSETSGKKVPPGLYCDYALLLIAEDKKEEAHAFLLKEKNAWTESHIFVDYLIQKHNLNK
jgi:hypothetical protein